MVKHEVTLTYFKQSGKYYTFGTYFSSKEHMFQIFEEVEEMKKKKNLPGLVSGYWEDSILVESNNNPHGYPGLIMPDKN
jgi:hypothetical protein